MPVQNRHFNKVSLLQGNIQFVEKSENGTALCIIHTNEFMSQLFYLHTFHKFNDSPRFSMLHIFDFTRKKSLNTKKDNAPCSTSSILPHSSLLPNSFAAKKGL